MNEMGVHLSVVDFRLLFEQIDFDNEGRIDYFKFCLLDADKEELRDNLRKKFQKSQLLKV